VELFLWSLLAAGGAAAFYFLIGIIPGTDETASIAPVTLILVVAGVPPEVVLAFFMAAIAAMQTANSVPSAIALIPGSTMAVPFLEPCTAARKLGLPHVALRKMLAASVLGTAIALPIAALFGGMLSGFGPFIQRYAGLAFFFGAVLIALFSRARWAAVASIIPFAVFVGSAQQYAGDQLGHRMFISFFMGIALGPLTIDILSLLNPGHARQARSSVESEVTIVKETSDHRKHIDPLNILGRRQSIIGAGFAALTSLTFVFSPVGMTVLTGELVERWKGSRLRRLLDKVVVMDAVTNSTYVAETLIPLIAIGLPLSPMALGPAAPLFNAPPVYTISETGPISNIHTLLTTSQIVLFAFIGLSVGLATSYLLSVRKARTWCIWTLKNISMESLAAAFIALAVVLAFNEAGVLGIATAFSTALISGLLFKTLGVHLGVLYMAFYASTFVMERLLS